MSVSSSDADDEAVVVKRQLRSRKVILVSSEDDTRTAAKRLGSPVSEGVLEHTEDRENEERVDTTMDGRKRLVERCFEDWLSRLCEKKKIGKGDKDECIRLIMRYREVMDEVMRENACLEGRVHEARSMLEEVRRSQKTPPTTPVPPKPTPRTSVPNKPTPRARVETKAAPVKAVPPKRDPPKKDPPKKDPPKNSPQNGSQVQQVEGEFVVVKRKRKKRKKAARVPPPPPPTRKDLRSESWRKKVEETKAKVPAKAFVIKVGDLGVEEAKKRVWADLLKASPAPRITNTVTLPRGDLLIRPADEGTYKTLKRMEEEGKQVREEVARRPLVMVYDVGREVGKERLAGMISDQNPGLGIEKGAVDPLFMKGPKTGETVWWVCAVTPDAYRKVVGKRIYVGMSCCRVIEFSDVVRCFKCQRFGHRATKCPASADTCGKCAEIGHLAKDCKSTRSRCANCQRAVTSAHVDCAARLRATLNAARRTDFGRQTK